MYREHKELGKEYDQQREKLKEARSEVKDKTKALVEQEKIFQETKERMNREAALDMARMLAESHRIMDRSKAILDKVQANYQTQVANYETQATVVATLIGKLKKEKEVVEALEESG